MRGLVRDAHLGLLWEGHEQTSNALDAVQRAGR